MADGGDQWDDDQARLWPVAWTDSSMLHTEEEYEPQFGVAGLALLYVFLSCYAGDNAPAWWRNSPWRKGTPW